jgi:outer membrane protein assembly factor BamA
MKVTQLFFLLLCAIVGGLPVAAQNTQISTQAADKLLATFTDTSAKIRINRIAIDGNTRTKTYIILREMQFAPGDSIQVSLLNAELQKARQQVYNTNLFNEVKIDVSATANNELDIHFAVKERWYIFPIPKFQLIDRNINEWIQQHNASLERVVYGIKFTHYNLTGRRDLLRLTLLNGFTRNISLSYSQPYANKALTRGFSGGAGITQFREYIYKTDTFNKPIFFNNGDFSRKNIFVNAGYSIRRGILYTHNFQLGFSHLSVVDSLLSDKYNSNYFRGTATHRNFADLSYTWQYVNANNAIYPLSGTIAGVRVLKRLGSRLDMFFVEGSYSRYQSLGRNWYSSFNFSGKITLPFNQPYINQRAMGYGEQYLRGNELLVIDGVAFGLLRSTLKKKLFAFDFPLPFRINKYNKIPFTFFAKTYADVGYTYNKPAFATRLNNKLLYSGGFGIDILTIYDLHLRVEYSFNQVGGRGLYIQAQSSL